MIITNKSSALINTLSVDLVNKNLKFNLTSNWEISGMVQMFLRIFFN